jgi:hypothetical protein
MSGGRYTKRIPEKIFFRELDNGWIQGPYVNKPKYLKNEDLKVFNLIEDGKEKEFKKESWEEFCRRIGVSPFMDKENVASFIYSQCIYVHEQKLNWRRQIVRIKKILDSMPKNNDTENQ